MKSQQYIFKTENFSNSDPNKYQDSDLKSEEMVISLGPQHPSTHGVLRLEVVSDGEVVVDVVPHLGYLHRCFEKHAESLPFNQTIPFVDRLDYMASMNSEHAYVMAIEKMMELEGKLPPRIEYIRVLVAEMNRIASHFVAVGTYGLDIGAYTPFLYLMRDREHIQRLLEWLSGARMLYNYIWVGSFGDHDATPEIIHLVLARVPNGEAGTRGLGLFLVPGHKDATGRQSNGISILRLTSASASCA